MNLSFILSAVIISSYLVLFSAFANAGVFLQCQTDSRPLVVNGWQPPQELDYAEQPFSTNGVMFGLLRDKVMMTLSGNEEDPEANEFILREIYTGNADHKESIDVVYEFKCNSNNTGTAQIRIKPYDLAVIPVKINYNCNCTHNLPEEPHSLIIDLARKASRANR